LLGGAGARTRRPLFVTESCGRLDRGAVWRRHPDVETLLAAGGDTGQIRLTDDGEPTTGR
jgi:hypothetical protein